MTLHWLRSHVELPFGLAILIRIQMCLTILRTNCTFNPDIHRDQESCAHGFNRPSIGSMGVEFKQEDCILTIEQVSLFRVEN